MLDRIEFVLSEAFIALRRNTWMTFAAITTVAMAMFLLGGLGFVYLSISKYTASLPEKFEMRVYLRDGLSPEEKESARKQVAGIPGVGSAGLVLKEEGWRTFQKQFPDIVNEIENPVPDMVSVKLTNLESVKPIAERIGAMAEVEPEGVRYLDDARELVSEAMTLVRWLGGALGGLMLLTSGVLIYNTIRMTIVARRREIRIMQLVGATRLMVQTPMIIEGILQGAMGGMIAALLIKGAHAGVSRILVGLNSTVKADALPLGLWIGVLCAVGAGYGLVCSLIALREPKRPREFVKP